MARVGSSREVLERSALGEQADGDTAGRDVPLNLATRADGGGSLLHDEELLSLVVGQRLVADDIGLGPEEEVGLWELRNGNARGTRAAVDMGSGESRRVCVLDEGDAIRREGRSLVGDESRRSVAVVRGSAVLVVGGRVVSDCSKTDLGQASTDVDAVEVKVLDRRAEVERLVGDVDDEAEAGGLLVRRIVGDNVDGRSSSGADKAKKSSRDKHLESSLFVCLVGWFEAELCLCWRLGFVVSG